MLIFVYGSLRKGFHNDIYLKDAEFIGNFQTLEKFYMYSYKSYPFPYILRKKLEKCTSEPIQIQGEVYKINESILKRLDVLEGHPDFYKRQEIEVESNTEKLIVESYILENDKILDEINDGIETLFVLISGGDWKRAIEEKDQKPYLPCTGR